jgi:hypothetical protein
MAIHGPGWHADPPGERYWDGTRWTEYRAFPQQPAVQISTWGADPVADHSAASATWWKRHRTVAGLAIVPISVAGGLVATGLIYVFNYSPRAEHEACVDNLVDTGSAEASAQRTCDRFVPDTGLF